MIYLILMFVFWISMCVYTVIIAKEFNKKRNRTKSISSNDILSAFMFLALLSIIWPLVLLLYIIKKIIGKIIGEEMLNLKKTMIIFLTDLY